ncbi:MAG: E3 binding domain-containing protein, partial [Solirubrobacterales bacterium]|nr:E3 binding domain-containing protein [Solirubrobacterales bacterium]
MPRLSDTMEDGTVLRWLKRDGEHVSRGDELVEIETDKASMIYESDLDGTLEILAREGDTLPVGRPIARVGAATPGAPPADGRAAGPAPSSPPPAAEVAAEAAAAAEAEAEAGAEAGSPPPADAQGEPGSPPPAAAGPASVAPSDASPSVEERVKASPLARRVAREGGLDLRGLSGTGPGGRIV